MSTSVVRRKPREPDGHGKADHDPLVSKDSSKAEDKNYMVCACCFII